MSLPWTTNHGSGNQLSMDHEFAKCLNHAGVGFLQNSLNAWGILTTDALLCHLLYYSDEGCLWMGMTRQQLRKLRYACYLYSLQSFLTLNEVHGRRELETATDDAERAAFVRFDSLDDALGVPTRTMDLPHEIINNIERPR